MKGGDCVRNRTLMSFFIFALVGMIATETFAQDDEGRRERRRRRRDVPRPKVGEVLEDFALKDVKGKEVKLSEFRDKKIFVLELGACT